MLDADTDDLLIYLILIAGAIAGGPSLLALVGVDAGAWLVSSGVLIDSSQALFEIPLLDAGPDWRRVSLVAIAFTFALVLWLVHHARRRGQGQS